ncbi:MAG: hypothetical protein AB7V56_10075 [Candidatus Nitrosocosmicus sp.]|nr:hypothetical protein [Candidatus Nitrosocosmicus sp.]
MGDTCRIAIGGEQTNTTYSRVDMLVPHGRGPSLLHTPHSKKSFIFWKERLL